MKRPGCDSVQALLSTIKVELYLISVLLTGINVVVVVMLVPEVFVHVL